MKKQMHRIAIASSRSGKQLALEAILQQVPFDGWTTAAFKSGLQNAGFSQTQASSIFPQGIYDVIREFGKMADDAMATRIKTESGYSTFRTREKVAFVVRARLEFLTPYREAMRRLMMWYALPLNWPAGIRRLYKTVDLVWRAAGDKSTDFNFYTKRGLLAGVIKTTTLFWLDDETPGCKASWDFLDRRIAEVLRIGQTLGKLRA